MAINQPRNTLFCFGLGYTASRLAGQLRAEGCIVAGTCRSEEQRAALRADGLDAVLFDRAQPLDDPAEALAGVTHLLGSVPPDEAGDAVLDCHGADIATCRNLRWVGYLSTTGPYGDHDGGWVDEDTPVTPSGVRGRRRADAEEGWLELWRRSGVPVHIFRLAGIYGPGRSVLDQLRAGTAKRIVKPGHVFSRIHVDDLVAVLLASIARPNPGAVYNVCDDMPASPAEVVEYGAELLGVAPPPEIPFDEAALSPMAASFYADNKRVRNTRIHEELGVALKYPDYKAGLRALLAGGGEGAG